MSINIDNEDHEIKYTCDETKSSEPCFSYDRTLPSLDETIQTMSPPPMSVIDALKVRFAPCEFCPTRFLKDVSSNATIPEPLYLDACNSTPRDKRIVFVDEPHRYFIDGNTEYVMSVSKLKGSFFEPFDRVLVATRMLNGKTFKNTVHRASHRYHGCKTVDDVLTKWDLWCDQGTALHRSIELCENQCEYQVDEDNLTCFKQYQDLFSDTRWVEWTVFRTEFSIFDDETLMSGQIDFLGLMNSKAQMIIIDWKRSYSIPDCFFRGAVPKYGKGCCNSVQDLKFYHYSIQLNTYKYILEKNYKFRVAKMYLIQMHPTRTLPAVLACPNMQHVVHEMMATRKIALTEMIQEDLAKGYVGRPK